MISEYTNYGRTVEVAVLNPSGRQTTFQSLPRKFSDTPRPSIDASIKYKTEGKPPKSVIKIKNPPRELVRECLANQRDTVVQVRAGYDGVLDLVFVGSPIKEGVKFSGGGGKDAELVLECLSGGSIYREAIATVSNTELLTAREVVFIVAAQAGLTVEGITEIPENFVYPNGYYATGNALDILQEIAFKTRTTMAWQSDGSIAFIGDLFAPDNFINVPHFDQEQSGVIGTPTLTDKGLKFRVLLKGTIRPGTYVSLRRWDWLENKYLTSTVRVSDVTFTLSTYGKNFYADIVGKEFNRAV